MDDWENYFSQNCLLKKATNIRKDNFVITDTMIEKDGNTCILEFLEDCDLDLANEFYTKSKKNQDTPFLKGWLNDYSWLYEVKISTLGY